MEKLKETLESLSLSNDEVKRLSEAFKKEEFKKLFREYAEEIQDPENRRKYEEELTAMENERGMDVDFINPIAGNVLKTYQNCEKKVFVNICHSEKIEKPNVSKTKNGGVKGATWSIPHSFSQPREDIDKKQKSCLVYDVVFNTNAYQMGSKNPRFRKMLHDTALEGIEKMFKVSLDKVNFKILKLKMKGVPVATVIRKKRSDFDEKQAEIMQQKDDPLTFPYPDIKETVKTKYCVNENNKMSNEFVKPVYKIIYSEDFEITNYIGEEVKRTIRPKKMIIEIKLPLVSTANSVDLDIDRMHLKLTTLKPVKYFLELKFTYPVVSDLGSAKFQKATKTLRLEIPVEQIPKLGQDITDVNFESKANNLIEESQLENSVNEEENIDVFDSISNVHPTVCSNDVEIKKIDEINRLVPNINMKFRVNDTYAFLLCEVQNINKTSWDVQYELLSPSRLQAIINFSNCGQGGWTNYYKLPLIFEIDGEITCLDYYIECLVCEKNMVIKIPQKINFKSVESVSFDNKVYRFKTEKPIRDWNVLYVSNKLNDVENAAPTFNIVYGQTNNSTMKIICVSLDCMLDVKEEFPEIEDDFEVDDVRLPVVEVTQDENLKNSTDTLVNTQPVLYENSSLDIKNSKLSILPTEYFETRSLEHRTNCPIDLCANLLFDLE